MPQNTIDIRFESTLPSASLRNEVYMIMEVKNCDAAKTYWCECEINVKPPLSLSHDGGLDRGKTRIGIITPLSSRTKKVKIFAPPNNQSDSYHLGVIAYMYDEEGAISERLERREDVKCVIIDNMIR